MPPGRGTRLSAHRVATRWIRTSVRDFARVHTALLVLGLKTAVKATPVLTGRARASWRVTKDRPNLDYDHRPDGAVPGISESAIAGDQVLNQQMQHAKKIKPGGEVWITNNVPYARLLEGGHSPKGKDMLRKAYGRMLAELPHIVDRVRAGGKA